MARRFASSWPLTVKIPTLVAMLMVAVSVLVSQQVLSRLQATQEKHLQEMGNAYLDGLSSSLIPALLRHDVWEAFDTIDRAKGMYRGLAPAGTIVLDAQAMVLAASDPRAVPTGLSLPANVAARFPPGGGFLAEDDGSRAYLSRDLVFQDRTLGSVYASFDTSHLAAERREVLLTLIASNAFITLILAILGYLVVKRMVRPIRLLSDHLQQSASSDVVPVPAEFQAARGETGRLFRSYGRLVDAVRERGELAQRLADEQRLASLGRLASGMAHEINNPLGGLFNSLDTLKRHGDKPLVRKATIALLERGLGGIRDVVKTALVSYRTGGECRPLQPADLADLRLLMRPETERRAITLNWTSELADSVAVDATKIRQTFLNLLLNACAASPNGSVVLFSARQAGTALVASIDDSGPGLPAEAARFLTSPDEPRSPYEPEAGLGLWLVRRLVAEMSGEMEVETSALGGTRIVLRIPLREQETLSDVA
ncbi:sensor histidine kinase [Aurantimonas endophytica]|uniref:histidine kinase n=1 Tax=Aurantimonas endophytica TaxID=1522175 RepID=A0A7W6HAG3_9HYPH|nr:HAMP domain-containing sensor histidine kinase [Aurantimonas endophytica]MBB4001333.1 signal transduction histidine kinase [Aurantimonas endophytica]MCO6403024.1 sensor histidine kinase [Aurantimonas endophytica]